jgi:hypothetical protein
MIYWTCLLDLSGQNNTHDLELIRFCTKVRRRFIFGVVTRLRPGISGVRFMAGARDFYRLQNIQIGSGPTKRRVRWVFGFFQG